MADVASVPVLPSDQFGRDSTYKADFARYLVRQDVLREIAQIDWKKLAEHAGDFVDPSKRTSDGLPQKAKELQDKLNSAPPSTSASELSVGIVGAGISGLYTAWICQYLGIKWHIYEADPERLGGRLYTYWFDESLAEQNKHDYYDIGAMRFPRSPIMDRTFKVIDATNTATGTYLMRDELGRQPSRYNDITYIPAEDKNPQKPSKVPDDVFRVSKKNGGPVPDDTVRDPDQILNDAFDRFRDKIKRAIELKKLDTETDEEFKIRKEADSKKAWDFLLRHDRFSLRDYLTFVEGETFETTHWLETLNAGTGWFDEAFTENVIDSLAFDYFSEDEKKKLAPSKMTNGPPIRSSVAPDTAAEFNEWRYIMNGSSSLVTNVLRKLETMIVGSGGKVTDKLFPQAKPADFPNVMKRISIGRRVTKMRQGGTGEKPMVLEHVDSRDATGDAEIVGLDAIFNSTTFGALQRMDLTGLDLPYDTKAAIRSLRYDPSTKVAIRFKKQWWTDKQRLPYVIKGGLGKTDMPLRTCVYPSYNIGEVPAVLLCSYTWGADSERVASMINESKMKDRKNLKRTDQLAQIMLDNLARLHTTNDKDYKDLFSYLNSDDVFDTYHAHDWSKDTYSCGGAFALFSPSQFSRIYPSVIRPLANSRFYMIGEAASAHHAWVVGALDSSARAMWQMLTRFKLFEARGKMVEEFGDVGEVDKETDYLQVALGMLPAKDRACATSAS